LVERKASQSRLARTAAPRFQYGSGRGESTHVKRSSSVSSQRVRA
jgi:hypothetical protein